MYRVLDDHINYLLPYIGMQFDNHGIKGMIFDIRTLQNKLEDKILSFYQNLSERELL